MLAQVATQTKIVRVDSAAELNRVIDYLAPGAASVLVIKDKTPMAARDRLIAELGEMRQLACLDNVRPDPLASDVTAMAKAVRMHPPEVLLAIGGGSTIDSAKGVAAVLANGGDLEDYLGAAPVRAIERRDIKLIAIPTTAGTGSEVTKVGVYTADGGRKYTLGHPLLQPDVAVHAPWLTHSLPPAVTASTGVDALSHALETLWNRNATPLSTRLAVDAAAHILRHIDRAFDASRDGGVEGRLEMLQGATHAGVAFSITGTAMVHALSFILGEEWHVPHGVACAFTLEDALAFNGGLPEVRERIGAIAAALGEKTADPVEWMRQTLVALKRRLGLPFTFADLGVRLAEGEIPRLFNKALADPKMKNNIVPVNEDAIFQILRGKL